MFLRELSEGSLRTRRLKAVALAGKSKDFNRRTRKGKPGSSRRIQTGSVSQTAFQYQIESPG